jgi:hypothetical protein
MLDGAAVNIIKETQNLFCFSRIFGDLLLLPFSLMWSDLRSSRSYACQSRCLEISEREDLRLFESD